MKRTKQDPSCDCFWLYALDRLGTTRNNYFVLSPKENPIISSSRFFGPQALQRWLESWHSSLRSMLARIIAINLVILIFDKSSLPRHLILTSWILALLSKLTVTTPRGFEDKGMFTRRCCQKLALFSKFQNFTRFFITSNLSTHA